MKKRLLTAALITCTATMAHAEKAPDHVYPDTIENGLVKHSFVLTPMDNEHDHLIEIRPSVKVKVDSCNKVSLGAETKIDILEGWGFSYYVVNTNGNLRSSLMGCADERRVEKQVYASRGELYDYNSKLPLVVYAPKGVTIEYRVWAPVD
ncbi:ecotin family protein [Vibrio mediterranei]|uniref:ecotin family protein n=1 Tax=Vibrio mediterranei TaxID=689 RepID=UPI0040681521